MKETRASNALLASLEQNSIQFNKGRVQMSAKHMQKETHKESATLTGISDVHIDSPLQTFYQREWMSKQCLFFVHILPWNLLTHFESSINNRATDSGFETRYKNKSPSRAVRLKHLH
jgi:hypothetical protein